jgi:hypothetical protein
MRTHSIRLYTIFLVFLLLFLPACSFSAAVPTPTLTPTAVTGALELTPTTGPATTPGSGKCLEQFAGDSLTGEPCIQGAYEVHVDVSSQPSDHETDHTVNSLTGEFSLWAVAPGQLAGTGHLSYALAATIQDTQATGCPVQTAKVAPFGWDVQLQGQFLKRPNGTVMVTFRATPAQGPTYTETFDCGLPAKTMPGINWTGLNGKLVNGVYDSRQDNPLPADATGEYYTLIHMELTY